VIAPDADAILAAVIGAVEDEIAPAVTDEYAASLCRTAAQMLRSVRVRVRVEQAALAEDNAELRALLAAIDLPLPVAVRDAVAAAVRQEPPAELPPLDALRGDALRLRSALAAVIDATPDDAAPVRWAARTYLEHQLERERAWQQDAFTGPRR
jgi:hypothetical protein